MNLDTPGANVTILKKIPPKMKNSQKLSQNIGGNC
jgi:hypothetical protein